MLLEDFINGAKIRVGDIIICLQLYVLFKNGWGGMLKEKVVTSRIVLQSVLGFYAVGGIRRWFTITSIIFDFELTSFSTLNIS